MSRHPRLMPDHPQLFTAEVVSSRRLAPSLQRVMIGGGDLAGFSWSGFDHWFRLFIPVDGVSLVLPRVSGRSWWKPYLAIPEHERPHCSNYTVADLRRIHEGAETERVEMEIDVVLHWDGAGELAGVARWAASVLPGSPLGLLDQGPLFDPPADTRAIHLVAEESGLPAVRGILRDLPPDAVGTAIVEVPTPGDAEQLIAPPGIEVSWIVRGAEERRSDAVPGTAALIALRAAAQVHPLDYAFVVGESRLATEGRRILHRAGLPKSRILFSGFWKHDGH